MRYCLIKLRQTLRSMVDASILATVLVTMPALSFATELDGAIETAEKERSKPFPSAPLSNALIEGLPLLIVEQDITEFENHMVYLEDPSGMLDVQEVFQRLGEFSPLPESGANFGLSPSAFWFAVKVEFKREEPSFVLDVLYPVLDHLEVYQIPVDRVEPGDKLKFVSVAKLGDRLNFSERYREHRTLNSRLLRWEGKQLLLLRVQTEGSVQVPAAIYSERAFGDRAAVENAGLFFFYGILVVMLVFNILLWVQTRDASIPSYIGYLVTYLAFSMTIHGTLFQWVLPGNPILANDLLVVSGFFALGLALTFTRKFNLEGLEGTRTERVFEVVSAFIFLSSAAGWFVPYVYSIKVMAFVGVVTPPLVVFGGALALRRGYKPARYFLAAWLIFMLGVIIYAVKTLGLLPSSWLADYAILVGSAVEVTLLSLALGDKMKQVAIERDALNTRVLEQTARLVSESQKRIEAEHTRVELERQGREDAESRVKVFADVIHHLNNPLSHLQGIYREGDVAFRSLVGTVVSLLPDEHEDREVMAVKDALKRDADRVELGFSSASSALARATSAVEVLRALSGVDGVSFQRHPFESIRKSLLRHSSDELKDLIVDLEKVDNLEVVGRPELYAKAISLIFESLQREGATDIRLELRHACGDQPFHTLMFLTSSEEASRCTLEEIGQLCEQLLSGYGSTCRVQGSNLALLLRASVDLLDSEEPTKAVEDTVWKLSRHLERK